MVRRPRGGLQRFGEASVDETPEPLGSAEMSVRLSIIANGGELSATLWAERQRRDTENRLQQVKQGSTVLASYTVRLSSRQSPSESSGQD